MIFIQLLRGAGQGAVPLRHIIGIPTAVLMMAFSSAYLFPAPKKCRRRADRRAPCQDSPARKAARVAEGLAATLPLPQELP